MQRPIRAYPALQALENAPDVPVPTVHALCRDASLIGGEFFLMEFVEGTATLTLIWAVANAFLRSTPPHTRRGTCPTQCPGLSDLTGGCKPMYKRCTNCVQIGASGRILGSPALHGLAKVWCGPCMAVESP